jgi:ketosteroid isomerase-like protein
MGEAENAELMRAAYERWNATNRLPVDLFDPDIVWDNPLTDEKRVHRGIDEVVRNMGDVLDSFEYMRNDPEQIVARDDLVVVVSRTKIRGRGSGVEYTNRAAHVWTVRDGRAIAFRVCQDVDEALLLVSR